MKYLALLFLAFVIAAPAGAYNFSKVDKDIPTIQKRTFKAMDNNDHLGRLGDGERIRDHLGKH